MHQKQGFTLFELVSNKTITMISTVALYTKFQHFTLDGQSVPDSANEVPKSAKGVQSLLV